MNYELRIDRLGFDVNKSYHNISSFSIWHESCVVKFFEIFRREPLLQFVREQWKLGRSAQILTPFVPERHLDETKCLLDRPFYQECFHDSVIIVNDLGLMRFVRERNPNRTMRGKSYRLSHGGKTLCAARDANMKTPVCCKPISKGGSL